MSYKNWVEKHFNIYAWSNHEAITICEFHDDSIPSMYINVNKGYFYCQACHAKGHISLLANKLNLNLQSSEPELDYLEKQFLEFLNPNINNQEKIIPELALQQYYIDKTYNWSDRGFNENIVQLFNLGYDFEHKAGVIPLRNLNGDCIALCKRFLRTDKKNRYWYTPGFQLKANLFAQEKITENEIVITEGPIDCISVWQAGFQAVALFSSVFHGYQASGYSGINSKGAQSHSKRLKEIGVCRVHLLLDNDSAGQQGALQAKQLLIQEGILVNIINIPKELGKDANDLTLQQRKDLINEFS